MIKLFFIKKEFLGDSVFRKQNTAIPPIWLIRQSEIFAENQTDTIRSLTLTQQHYIAPGRTRLPGAGNAVSPPKKSYLPILGTEHYSKADKMKGLFYGYGKLPK